MAKPHISKLVTTGRWCCSMRKTEPGFGVTPREAFRDWRLQNCGRYIDLRRYAGTYGGAHIAVATHDAVWDAWKVCNWRIVGALVAAAVLWLLWV